LPYHLYKDQTADLEEERRLFYVGMTRAQHVLYLTWAQSRRLNGRPYTLKKSPFLAAIEKELTEQNQTLYQKRTKPSDNQLKLFQ
jgi:superfamily I DNA/RNA helicase